MHIHNASKNDMKTATTVRDIHQYIYIVVYIILNNCIYLAAWMYYTLDETWCGNGSIWASTHPQLIFDA